ncbi:MAG: ATP synthase F1 subunit delta [Omnitrophica WOR_2 bacterium GWF2_43_52]|nr:MAG: ATP synthase F1 subunit delta [Omnitrophica WOR_2 bacterium GWA2_44_7]OGX20765.1 MAG: ATP synthase F1 subunit delta [Omnitrophica WOR_2 bacterium GWF2_43_52]HAH19788.1 ATP synthase F1 subunit delta [Candidatus Omnitrophota bacterium]HBG63413.1 ATP synthase F1 subunit delta [Candidatus Omnitrophota bacterium]
MKDDVLAKRYADAFLSYACQGLSEEKALDDFKKAREILLENKELILDFLEAPAVTVLEKNAFIDKFFGEGFSEEFRQFLKFLLKKNRIDKLWDVAEYVRVAYSHGKSVRALLKTSFPLDLELVQLIIDSLERKFQRKIKLYIELDGELLGGVKVVIGNKVIDGSVKRRIERLKERFETLRTA